MKIGVISDVHSNFVALKTVLNFLRSKIDLLICAGDFVGYGPSPSKCIDELINFSQPYIYCLGNHDLGVRYIFSFQEKKPLKNDQKILNKFRFSKAAEEMLSRNAGELKNRHFDFLVNLRYKEIMKQTDFTFYLTHGTPSNRRSDNVGKYLFAPPQESYENILRRLSRDKHAYIANFVIVGHTHQRFLIETNRLFYWSLIDDLLNNKKTEFPISFSFKNKRVLINPGSVGQPRDGSGNASFVVMDLNKKNVVFHDLDYPREEFYELVRQKCVPDIHGNTFWANKFGHFSKEP